MFNKDEKKILKVGLCFKIMIQIVMLIVDFLFEDFDNSTDLLLPVDTSPMH